MPAQSGWLSKRKTFPGATTHMLWYWHVWSHLGKGRSQRNEKIWVFLYMYFTSRAIRIESTNSLSGGAFIQPLQRIVSRRADIWVNTTKNDTNFVGDSAELNKGFSEINHKKIN